MKKLSLILCLVLTIVQIGKAQWSSGLHLNYARYGLDVVDYEGKIYAIGGRGSQKLEVLENNIWKELQPLPQAQGYLAAARVANKIYTFGSEGWSNITQIYDIDADTWQSGPTIPQGLYWATAEAVGNDIYLIGGYSSAGALNTLYILDTEANTWSQGANIPTIIPTSFQGPASAVFGDFIYVFGNYGEYYKYDINSNSWSTFTGPPSGHGRDAEAVTVNSEIYLMGGTPSNIYEAYTTVEIYDPSSDTWSAGPDLNIGRYQFGATYACNKLYAIGGRDKHAQAINSVEILRFEPFTEIGGVFTGITTLYPNESPYIATDDITVADGAVLTIADGVTIKFPRNYFGISVDGTLNATGVTFTAENPPSDPCGSFWQAIFFWPGSDGMLNNCTIEYAGSIVRQYHPDGSGQYLDALGNIVISGDATVTLNNCTVSNSFRSGIWTEAVTSNVEILSVVAENNNVDGLHCKSGSTPVVSGSQFLSNVYHGVELVNSSPSFTSCIFSNNPVGLHCLSSLNVEAVGCQFNSNSQYGARIVDSSPTFISCTFSGNSRDGLGTVNSTPTFTGGRFENNVRFGIKIEGQNAPSLNGIQVIAGNGEWGVINQTNPVVVVLAKKIYWGDPTGPHDVSNSDGLDLENLDGLGDNVSEYVDWNPYRSSILEVDPDLSEISVEPSEIRADGLSRTLITITPRAPNGELVGEGLEVSIYTIPENLTVQNITDNRDGTYTQELQAPLVPGTATITANVESISLNNSAEVVFYGAIDPSLSTITANPVEILVGGSTSIITVTPKDANGVNTGKGLDVAIWKTTGTGTWKGNVHSEQDGVI